MVSFQVASDLHLEFNRDDGLIPKADILILAGDVCPFSRELNLNYIRLLKKFKTIVHVPGNHEYYSKDTRSMQRCLEIGREKAATFDGRVIILDNETTDFGNVRIIGSTLWSHVPDEHVVEVHSQMNDYRNIFTNRGALEVKDTNAFYDECVEFIRDAVKSAIEENRIPVVVTHHAPQMIGTGNPLFIGTGGNTAFATDCQHLYPGVHTWIFGHTHYSCDFVDEETGTRVLSNPKGYPGESRVMFRRNFVVEIPC